MSPSTPVQPLPQRHFVSGRSLQPPYDGREILVVGMGCFWGAERCYDEAPGVWVTMVGYAGGVCADPTYEAVCSGTTGHAEVVRVVFDPEVTTLQAMLQIFWESHDPTSGMRQGNDVGTQYRSVIFTSTPGQFEAARRSREMYQAALDQAGLGTITTEIQAAGAFFFAEKKHQQYLAKNPHGYCGLGGTGVACPIGTT